MDEIREKTDLREKIIKMMESEDTEMNKLGAILIFNDWGRWYVSSFSLSEGRYFKGILFQRQDMTIFRIGQHLSCRDTCHYRETLIGTYPIIHL